MYRGNEPLPANASEEEALDFLVSLLRENRQLGKYGYQVYLPGIVDEFLYSVANIPRNRPPAGHWTEALSPVFLAAAWSLCRLGVLRPGVERFDGQVVGDNKGYSLTPFGKQWIAETDDPLFIPSDALRTTNMLLAVADHFGDPYRVRAQEASRCYSSHAFLACCVMVGASAEAILLAAGSAKLGEEPALKVYRSGSGRARLQKTLLGEAPEWMRREFESHTGLITYWRDQAAHGHVSKISESEAFMALRGLLRFAHFANDNWQNITKIQS